MHAGLVGDSKAEGSTRRPGPPLAERRRTTPWPGVTMTRYCLVSFDRLSVGQPTGRGEGVSSWRNIALKPGDRLQRSSERSTGTCVSPPGEPHVRSL